MKTATSTEEEKIPPNTSRRRKPGEKAATSTAMWKTEEKIPPNTRRRKMPGENFINTYEETRKALEEVDANRNGTDLDKKTQKTLEDIISNRPSCRPDVVSSGSSKVIPENPKEVESVAEKVVDKTETIEENDETITNEKLSEHIGRRGMVLRSVLMSSPRRSSKTLNPGDRCIFKTRKSMTEHTCARSRSQSFRRKSPRPKQKIGHITNVLGPVTRSRARTSLCYKAFIS